MAEINPPTLGVWAVAATFRSPDGEQDVHVVDVVPGTNQADAFARFVAGFIQATKLDWKLATTACAPVSEEWLQNALSVMRGGNGSKVVSLREVEKSPEPEQTASSWAHPFRHDGATGMCATCGQSALASCHNAPARL